MTMLEPTAPRPAPLDWELAAFERRLAAPSPMLAPPLHGVRLPLDLVLRHRWAVAAILLAALLFGMVLHALHQPVFRATARIELSAPAARVIEEMAPVAPAADQRVFQTAIEKLRGLAVAERTVEAHDLHENPAFHPSGPTTPAHAAHHIRQGLQVSLLRNTAILAVSFDHPDPALAQRVANGLAQSFIAERQSETLAASSAARRFLEGQAASARMRLEASEQRLLAFAETEGVSPTGEAGSLVAQTIAALNAELSRAIAARVALQAETARIDQGEGHALQAVLENEALAALKGRTAALRADYEQRRATFKPEFPAMRSLRAEINAFQGQADALTKAILGSITARRDEAVLKEEQLRAQLARLEDEQRAVSRKAVPLSILRREADADRAQYEGLIARASALGVASGIEEPTARVIDPASLPDAPVRPSFVRTMIGALLLGLCGAVAFVFARERLGAGFRWPAEAEEALALPVLAALPFAQPARLADGRIDAGSPLAEAVRSLRATLQAAGFCGPPRLLLLTSAVPGEGKTTAALALARGFSELGHRVLLIECDLRRPTLAARLGLSPEKGLGTILGAQVERNGLAALFRPVGGNLSVLPAGSHSRNPADLLSSPRMARLLGALGRRYDIVIMDAPPVLGLADAPILSRLAEATLLVTAATSTPRPAVEQAIRRLREAGGHVTGLALSKFRPTGRADARLYAYTPAPETLSGDPPPSFLTRLFRP
ncbi:MAG: hypothetical protein DI629_07850 [Mesorhizobium amorphae]|nr:MAG: hypothetical protein DI629_07850 [Mesorhizobium amorphae]